MILVKRCRFATCMTDGPWITTSQYVDCKALQLLYADLARQWLRVHADALVRRQLWGLHSYSSPATPGLLLLHPCTHGARLSFCLQAWLCPAGCELASWAGPFTLACLSRTDGFVPVSSYVFQLLAYYPDHKWGNKHAKWVNSRQAPRLHSSKVE
jgi:hypothetical protein